MTSRCWTLKKAGRSLSQLCARRKWLAGGLKIGLKDVSEGLLEIEAVEIALGPPAAQELVNSGMGGGGVRWDGTPGGNIFVVPLEVSAWF